MPDRIECKYCGKTGFVRRERVIKAEHAIAVYYCGACNRSWEVTEDDTRARRDERKPISDDDGEDRGGP